MARFTGDVFSKTLDLDTALTVVTPRRNADYEACYRVIYLLHGLSDDYRSWAHNTQISLLADKYQLVFVMPEVARSFYIDMKYGPRYFTYIADELPKLCRNLFNICPERENTGVFGLSMGGYGALQCALRRPDVFGMCGAFSALTDVNMLLDAAGPGNPEVQAVFGLDYETGPAHDLRNMVAEAAASAHRVRYFATAGTEDYTLEMNRSFRDQMQGAGMDYQYAEFAGGHDWYFWNSSIHKALEVLLGSD